MAKPKDKVKNGHNLSAYFTQFPNLIDDADLTPHEFRVLLHYYRVGECWEGVRATAKKCKMSVGKVSDVRKSLAAKGFIQIDLNDEMDGSVTIEVTDLAEENVKKYRHGGVQDANTSVHSVNASVHKVNDSRSLDERKNTPVKNTKLRNTPLPPSGDESLGDDEFFENEKNTNASNGGGEAATPDGSIEERIIKFSNAVIDSGGTVYTPLMLENFIEYWTEQEVENPNRKRKHPRLKFEAEGFFHIKRRLKLWAKNNFDNVQCYLSAESARLVNEKKAAFKKQLEPFLPRYGKDMLNDFYRHWSQPENTPEPRRLAWECTEFWDLANRLASWQSRNNKPKY